MGENSTKPFLNLVIYLVFFKLGIVFDKKLIYPMSLKKIITLIITFMLINNIKSHIPCITH